MPNPTATATDDVVCDGENATLTSNGGVSYTWTGPNSYSANTQNISFTPATAADAGVYTVTVTDGNSCTATATATLTINPLPSFTPTASVSSSCEGDFVQLDAGYTGLNQIYFEGFEGTGSFVTQTNTPSIPGATNWGYSNLGPGGRIRTGAFSRTGNNAVTLDESGGSGDETNFLIGTYDLSAYTSSDLQLEFWLNDHGDETDPEDRVWVRGSSSDPWVEVYNWATTLSIGSWTQVIIDLDAALAGAIPSQSLSSTTAVRFGQRDNM